MTAGGNPGPSVAKATQNTASDTDTYRVSPQRTGPYQTLPQPDDVRVAGVQGALDMGFYNMARTRP